MAELDDVLQVIRSYRDYPGINGRNQVYEMAGAAASIAEMIVAVKSNKGALSAIGRNACEIVANVIKISHTSERSTFTDSKMDALQANLRDIKNLVEKHVNRRGLMKMRILHYYFSEVKTIRKCRNRLQKCYDVLEFQYTEETRDNVRALTRHVQELLERQIQRSPEQMSVAPDASLDSSVGEPGPATEGEGNSRVTREGGDNPTNHQAADTVNSSTSRPREEGTCFIRENQTDTAGNSISYTQIAGNAVSSAIRTVIDVRGSGNRFYITLRA